MRRIIIGSALFAVGLSSGLYLAPFLQGPCPMADADYVSFRDAATLAVTIVVSSIALSMLWRGLRRVVRAAYHWSATGG
jgi:hypothetical protein